MAAVGEWQGSETINAACLLLVELDGKPPGPLGLALIRRALAELFEALAAVEIPPPEPVALSPALPGWDEVETMRYLRGG